jgi:hypothetical protein
MSDETLRVQARDAIRAKRIPDQHPRRMWRGAADREQCTICGSPVGGLGLDLEFVRESGAVRYPVHVDCFAAWELECDPGTPS